MESKIEWIIPSKSLHLLTQVHPRRGIIYCMSMCFLKYKHFLSSLAHIVEMLLRIIEGAASYIPHTWIDLVTWTLNDCFQYWDIQCFLQLEGSN